MGMGVSGLVCWGCTADLLGGWVVLGGGKEERGGGMPVRCQWR